LPRLILRSRAPEPPWLRRGQQAFTIREWKLWVKSGLCRKSEARRRSGFLDLS